MKRIISVFFISFILNLIWENLHSVLYADYMGGKITEFILLRAALVDGVIIAIITLPFIFSPLFKKQSWLIILIGFIVSVFIEHYALGTGRWAYNTLMPIIPFLSLGLTPILQLGLLGYASFKIEDYLTSGFSSSPK